MSTPNFSRSQIENEFKKKFNNRVLFQEPLAPYVSYHVGGPADIFIFPQDENELTWISQAARRFKLPITLIGSGTNLLVPDEGIRGITISLNKGFQNVKTVSKKDSFVLVCVGGGIEKAKLLDWSIENNLSGLEFSAGIPGTVGGGIFMNAGTKFGCFGDIIEETRIFDFHCGAKVFTKDEIKFDYRKQNIIKKDTLVLSATLRLTPGVGKDIKKQVTQIIQERAEKQPLDYPSCGSTFKNPQGQSAGRLIEKAGLKGLKAGGAEISLKHANFILNKGNATAEDIEKLIQMVKDRIQDQFNIKLDCELITLDPNGSFVL